MFVSIHQELKFYHIFFVLWYHKNKLYVNIDLKKKKIQRNLYNKYIPTWFDEIIFLCKIKRIEGFEKNSNTSIDKVKILIILNTYLFLPFANIMAIQLANREINKFMVKVFQSHMLPQSNIIYR